MTSPADSVSYSVSSPTPNGTTDLILPFPLSAMMWKLALPLLAACALAQNPGPPAFEVASVKVDRQQPFVDRVLNVEGATLTIRNQTLRVIAAWAFDLQRSQIAGPPQIDSDRFDILARSAKPSSEAEMRPMLRTLLAERFHLASHRETRSAD